MTIESSVTAPGLSNTMATLNKNKGQKQNAYVKQANTTILELDLEDVSTAVWKKCALYHSCSWRGIQSAQLLHPQLPSIIKNNLKFLNKET